MNAGPARGAGFPGHLHCAADHSVTWHCLLAAWLVVRQELCPQAEACNLCSDRCPPSFSPVTSQEAACQSFGCVQGSPGAEPAAAAAALPGHCSLRVPLPPGPGYACSVQIQGYQPHSGLRCPGISARLVPGSCPAIVPGVPCCGQDLTPGMPVVHVLDPFSW